MKKISIPVIFLGTILSLSACKQKAEFKTVDGLEYAIIKDASGDKKPVAGKDYVSLHLKVHIGDSVLFDSRKMNENEPVIFLLQAPKFKGDVAAGFAMLTTGDSAVFRVPVDSMTKQGAQLLPWMKPGMKLEYNVNMLGILTEAEAKKKMEEMQKKMMEKMQADMNKNAGADDQKLQEHFKSKNINPTKTASGLYYTINTPGSGENIKPGQVAEVKYIGTTLAGKVFDANTGPQAKRSDLFSVTVGQGMVIRGWDEGLQLLKKGSKATFYIPSALAYGPQGAGADIGPNENLIFDVEVVNVKDK
jgi:FKBP-type peptidyl-prolyl cis-trans isomerase FkpA